MYADFAALIQKRDITGSDATKQAFTVEMDGGANPNKMQFVLARDLFLKNAQVINTDKYYIINVNQQGNLQTASFITNGSVEGTNFYNLPVQATNATLILGGFQPMNVAEVVLFNSDVNMAQIKLVTNALAAKYNLTLSGGDAAGSLAFKNDIIGIGKDRNITNTADDTHLFSSGGALELKTATIASAGDYLFAGHNGSAVVENETTKQWSRVYYIKSVGSISNVVVGFDYGKAGLTSVPDNTYKLYFKATEAGAWADAGAVAAYDAARNVLSFTLGTVPTGFYVVSKSLPSGIDLNQNPADFTIYPNPTTDHLNIDLKNAAFGKVELRIFDLTGRMISMEVEQKSETKWTRSLDVSGLEPGAYLLEIRQSGNRTVKMFNKKL